jgi:peptide/nickel transport system permease protein
VERAVRRNGAADTVIGFLLRRSAFGLIALWAIGTFTFFLVHFAPGGPAVALGGEYGAPGYLEDVARQYGLDRPLWQIYLDYIGRLVRGDLGFSYRASAPVSALIAERLPVTLAIMLPSVILSAWLGVRLAEAFAARPKGGGRTAVALLAAFHAIPTYVVGLALVMALAVGLAWFPVHGLVDPRAPPSGFSETVLAWVCHLALPVLALALHQISFTALMTRARLREEMARPYFVTARAKGLSIGAALRRHALRNALLPVLTLSGTRLGVLVGGALVIETLFALPGLGRLAISAALARDHPTVIGVTIVGCAAIVVVNLAVDVAVAALDPRTSERAP